MTEKDINTLQAQLRTSQDALIQLQLEHDEAQRAVTQADTRFAALAVREPSESELRNWPRENQGSRCMWYYVRDLLLTVQEPK